VKDDRVYLLHIRDALDRVREYTVAGREAFLADGRTQDAVVRNLEIVGEAAKRLSAGVRDRAPDIPWKAVAGLRDKLIHDYFGVTLDIVWQVVDREAPALRRRVEALLDMQP
jgi:uncharacterized protein with HEPN domain